MPPVLFLVLVLSGAFLLLLALTVGPKNNRLLGLMLLVGALLLLVPLGWLLLNQMGV